MKMKILVGLLVFLIVVNLATVGSYVYYIYFRHPGDRRPPEMPGLNEEERTKIKGVLDTFEESTRELRDRARDLETELVDLLQENPVDRQKLDATLKELSGLRLEISRKSVEQLIEAKSFLPSEIQHDFFRRLLDQRPGMPPGGPPMNPRFDRPPFPDRPPEKE